MNRSLLGVLVAALLAGCAPAVTGPQPGRIVNSVTGEEGRLTFAPGSLRPRLGEPFAPDNATIVIGGQTYSGRTAILDSGSASTLPAGWGLSLSFGGSAITGSGNQLGLGAQVGTPDRRAAPVARIGNLIARTAGASPRTLTCTLTVDEREHGIGECTGNDGVKYALQF
ncbi:hypothetical protein CVO96_16165 [Deinococcus koreensis]|uniref:Uncharacterized protein n=1 Tax=Deinococcus koreensis TaxID=2054903 RepID=A0A2K3V2X4_9DEIO|nr:hypothetical protein CVO96_16165 [Deinococcus koreensis]